MTWDFQVIDDDGIEQEICFWLNPFHREAAKLFVLAWPYHFPSAILDHSTVDTTLERTEKALSILVRLQPYFSQTRQTSWLEPLISVAAL